MFSLVNNLLSPSSQGASRSRPGPRGHRQLGWIGIDVGTSSTKLAQVERAGSTYRIVGRTTLDTESGEPPHAATGYADDFRRLGLQLKLTRNLFRGRRAAAALPASLTTCRHMELPPGTREELRRMIGQELHAEPSDQAREPCFAFWKTNLQGSSGEAHPIEVLEVERDVPLQLSAAFDTAGLDCRLLDALPCALARAAKFAEPPGCQTPTAMLELGHSSTVLVIAGNGEPLFTRVLRDCGLRHFTAALSAHLQLTSTGARQLLGRFGVSGPNELHETDSPAVAIQQLLSGPLEGLLAELARTLNFLRECRKSLFPARLLLTGGGACIRNLPERLALAVEIETRKWALPGAEIHPAGTDDAQFAVAVALSSLAWET